MSRLELAARVMGARHAHGETVDSRLPADHVRWNRSFHHYLADQLGHEAFQQAVTEGRKLSVDEAFEAVLAPIRS
jgi:hypothetical protein